MHKSDDSYDMCTFAESVLKTTGSMFCAGTTHNFQQGEYDDSSCTAESKMKIYMCIYVLVICVCDLSKRLESR